MTVIERAIESAKNRKYKLENDLSYNISDLHRKKASGQREVMQVTIEALEKQIPKKPIEYEDKYYACPRCEGTVMYKWDEYPTKLKSKKYGLPYCLGCGQKLDWSEEDD